MIMKKFLCLLLAVLLTLGTLALMSSGKNSTDDDGAQSGENNTAQTTDAPENAQTTAPADTDKNTIVDEAGNILSYYNDDITFVLPENYMKLDTETVSSYFDITSGNEVTVLYADALTLYDDMTTELFTALFKESYEADGTVISDISVTHEEIDGFKLTHIYYASEKDGKTQRNTQYIVTVEDTTYFVNITENTEENTLSKKILDTFRILKKAETE